MFTNQHYRSSIRWAGFITKIGLLFFSMYVAIGLANAAFPEGLKIVVLQGDGVTNVISRSKGERLIVRVEDASGHPVSGAEVLFELPSSGPSGFFKKTKYAKVITRRDGRAVTRKFRPNGLAGKFELRVTAQFQELRASATMTQTNVLKLEKSSSLAGGGGCLGNRSSQSCDYSSCAIAQVLFPTFTCGRRWKGLEK